MSNRWNIPDWLENEIRERDKCCVYCGETFTDPKTSRKTAASWEHIINDENIITRENIALCCVGCNSSKGTKDLRAWITSDYCKRKNISDKTVTDVIKNALLYNPWPCPK
jgi:hypothetical protein